MNANQLLVDLMCIGFVGVIAGVFILFTRGYSLITLPTWDLLWIIFFSFSGGVLFTRKVQELQARIRAEKNTIAP